MGIIVYFHPTCPTSIKLLKKLWEERLHEKVLLIDVSESPYRAFEKGLLSVPGVEIDGKIVVQGVLFNEVLEFIVKGEAITIPYRGPSELVKRFMRGVLESFAVTSWAYVNWRLTPILENESFTSSVIGVYGIDYENAIKGLVESVKSSEERLLEEYSKYMVRSAAYNYIRELYWLGGVDSIKRGSIHRVGLEELGHWLMLRSSIGRVGLNIRPLSEELKRRIDKVREYLLENFEEIIEKILREQEENKKTYETLRKELFKTSPSRT